MQTLSKEELAAMTPDEALALLEAGNQRFVAGKKENHKLQQQVAETSEGQQPFAVVLGCIDSRVPPELIFDQGIGDIFSIRVAGNILNEDVLGSMEFACELAGSKLIVVLGHTGCGAVEGAVEGVRMGKLTGLVNKLKPAVNAARRAAKQDKEVLVDLAAEQNVRVTVNDIPRQSRVLKALLDQEAIEIVGAMYDVANGKVDFLD